MLYALLPVGLPGSGKTTALRAVSARLVAERVCDVFYVSRDNLQKGVIDNRSLVHARMLTALADGKEYARRIPRPTLVVIDACNSTRNGRAAWVSALEPCRHVLTVNFPDIGTAALVVRIKARGPHPTLGPEEAESAVVQVRGRLEVEEDRHSEDFHRTVIAFANVNQTVEHVKRLVVPMPPSACRIVEFNYLKKWRRQQAR